MPQRIQLRRTKGWKLPEGAVVVSRPSKWGNPFKVGDRINADDGTIAVCFSAREAVDAYRSFCNHPIGRVFRADVIKQLHGKDLACWCPLDGPCHADVLLEIANA